MIESSVISSGLAHFFDAEDNLCVFAAEEDTTGYLVNGGGSQGAAASTGFSLAGKKGGVIASKQTKLFDTYGSFNLRNHSVMMV